MGMSVLILLSFALLVRIIKEQETFNTLQETVTLQSQFIDKWKAERQADIRYLASMTGRAGIDLNRIKSEFEQFTLTHPDYDTLSFIDKSGVIQWNSSGAGGSTNVGDRDYFLAAAKKSDYVSDVIESRVTGRLIVVFISPVVGPSGDFQGGVAGSVRLNTLDELMHQFQLGTTGETYILNRNGYRITKAVPGSDETRLSRQYVTAIFERALANRQDTSAYLNPDGTKVFGAFSWTQDHSWIIVGELAYKEVFRPYYTLLKVMVVITLGILLICYVLALSLTRRMEDVIGHLLHGTTRIREGQYGYQIDRQVIDSAPSELRELSDNFNVMSEKLQSTVLLLEESAVVDHLTEVYNRRFLMNEGNKMMMSSLRAGSPCSVLLIDADFFKSVNDRYGHLIGDRVLKHIAEVLVGCVRASDVVARYGGEEFVVLATNCDLQQGQELAERIRTWVESSPYREEAITIRLSVSIGVTQNSTVRQYGTNVLEDMIERADKALYKAKHRGRNRVVAEPAPAEEDEGKEKEKDKDKESKGGA